jgi:hypothetical protein
VWCWIKKQATSSQQENTANDYVLSFNSGPVLVKGNAAVVTSKAYKEENSQVVEFAYSGNMKYVKWKINSSGWTTMDYEYNIEGDQPFSGISFQLS